MAVKTLLSLYATPQKDFPYALLSTVIPLSVTTSCVLAAPPEIFAALQSATQFLLVHSICYHIIYTGLSLPLATFPLYQALLRHNSCVCVPLCVFYI